MAKAGNSRKSKSKAKKKADTPGKGVQIQNNIRKTVSFLRSERGRKVIALTLILGSIFLLVSQISHFFTGPEDQSVVESGLGGNPDLESPSNWLGSVGAWLGYRFITAGFGICSLLIPIFTGFFGFALLENKYYAFVVSTLKYVTFTVLWGSAFFAFLSLVLSGNSGDLGGGFGTFLSETLFNYIGKPGMGIVLALTLGVFLIITLNPDFSVMNLFRKKVPSTDSEGKTTESDETGAETETDETSESESSDPTPEPEPEEEEDFVISVRKEEENKAEEEDEASAETQSEDKSDDKSDAAESEKDGDEIDRKLADLKKEVGIGEEEETPDFLTLAIENSNPTPTPTPSPDGGLTLEIDESEKDPVISMESDDNIVEVKDQKFEKFVPEEDKESVKEGEDVGDWEAFDPTKELSDYQYPPIELLKAYDTAKSREVNRNELEENKNKIVTTLNHYKIEITHIKATIGPTVTLYEIVPAPGVRISKIRNLEDDIALSLAALGIRIIAPIPGKGTIGIEIPNSNPEIVSMRSTLATEKFKATDKALPLALGRTISNEVFIADLAKMPHLLIAGATGQGKSVGINGLISSILYKKHPAQVKFVLIDPKKVELNLYSALESHFLAKLESFDEPIITDTKQVIYVLNSLCIEMDTRYDLLKKAKVRNITEYNEKFVNRRLNPRKGHKFMPYIVLIIDEFADLMMTAGKEIETPIARLAQLARAIGIHLVLATQRPSVNVITGIIKANFPARISFRVTSKVDSRTILDAGGADQLIGRGDMLLSTGSELVRIQNAFIDTPEVDKLVDFISNQRGYPEPYFLPEVPDPDAEEAGEVDMDDLDEMFGDAARLVVKHQQGSTSLVQRRLSLGYNRAGRIIDQLEKAGVVGQFAGSKARDVLIQDEATLEQLLRDLNAW